MRWKPVKNTSAYEEAIQRSLETISREEIDVNTINNNLLVAIETAESQCKIHSSKKRRINSAQR